MDKESIYLLQKIDCNCNDCKFMIRDLTKFNYHKKKDEELQRLLFTMKKEMAIKNANDLPEDKRQNALKLANNMVFVFEGTPNRVQYGTCTSSNTPISFIPNICQLETQHCFQHRKDN